MDLVTNIITMIWDSLKDRKKFSFNVFNMNNNITVSIFLGKKIKIFTYKDNNIFLEELKNYLKTI
jgi:hypothetical protein